MYCKTIIDNPLKISRNLLDILEIHPTIYYYQLCQLEEKYTPQHILKIINDTSYNKVYHGNHLHALVYITGLKKNELDSSTYGHNSFVFQKLAIQILDKLIEYNVDLYGINIEDKIPLDYFYGDDKIDRFNHLFKRNVILYYKKKIVRCIDDLQVDSREDNQSNEEENNKSNEESQVEN